MTRLISVIVPVFNAELYIHKCLTSIINQTYKNIEIIVINDGSEDHSAQLCDEFALQDNRIKVFHQSNSGLSAVRNKGIRLAKGDYIGFVDCDDSIHPEMYELLLNNLIKHQTDISICNYSRVFDQDLAGHIRKSNLSIKHQRIFFFKKEEAFERLFSEFYLIMVVPWNKLYKKTVFNNIKYPVGKVNDDEFVIHHIIQASDRFIYTNADLYYYYHNPSSITKAKYNLKRLNKIEAVKDRLLLLQKQSHNELMPKAANAYLNLIILNYDSVKEVYPEKKEVLKELIKEFKSGFKSYKSYLNYKNYVELKLFCITPYMYRKYISGRKFLSGLKRSLGFLYRAKST